MDPRGSSGRARPPARARASRRLLALAALTVLALLAAGCSQAGSPPHPSSSSTAGAATTRCGATRTAANVPVDVEVVRGHASCGTALTVERSYAEAIRSGKAPGNGGGGPVHVHGWTCQGFATPVVLATGKASKCIRSGSEILAVLPPTSSG
ncbi:MAG TPA: hypothetical protein VLX31_00515 [Streptosporangiaceae bacterium]|nr:hypothetical protein [Streptosporangiaceae bacterium]